MSRRALLVSGAAAALAAAGVGIFTGRRPASASDALRWLVAQLREEFPDAAGLSRPMRQALGGLQAGLSLEEFSLRALGIERDEAARISVPAVKDRLAAAAERDFTEGHVVTAGGWMLSQAEARLLLLLAGPAGADDR